MSLFFRMLKKARLFFLSPQPSYLVSRSNRVKFTHLPQAKQRNNAATPPNDHNQPDISVVKS